MFEMAMSHGLININNIPKPIHKVVAATEDGKQVPFAVLHEIYEAYICFLRRCEEYFLCQYLPPPDIVSVGDHIMLETELYLNNIDDPKEKRIRQLIFNCLLKRETCITGCHSMNEIDLLELGSYTELQGGNIVLPSGYSSILKPLCDNLPENSISTSCPVKSIHWKWKKNKSNFGESNLTTVEEETVSCESDDSDKTVTDVPLNTQSNVRIICENGDIYEADHIICTIPLGCLKELTTNQNNENNFFIPELPQYKLESIERLLYGTVDKIFLEYDRPFLNSSVSEIMFIWDNSNTIPGASDSVESEHSDDYIKKNWYKKIYSFSKISDTLLLGWISGREAEFMETLSHEIVAEKCTEILRIFLKDPFVPKPKRCIW